MMRLRKQDKKDTSIDLVNFNRAMDRVNQLSNITVANGTVQFSPSGVHIAVSPEGGGFDLDSTVCFGYKLDPDGDNPDEVRIYDGEIDRIAVAETDLHPIADDDYAYVRRTKSDDTMLITNGASVPADDATYLHYKLYQFTVTNGVVSIKRIWRPFAIESTQGFSGEVTVMTDLRYDTSTYQFQKKTKLKTYLNGALLTVGDESAWTLITGGQAVGCD